MKLAHPDAETVECPTCGAKPGEHCKQTVPPHWHPAPRDLALVDTPLAVLYYARVGRIRHTSHAERRP